MAEGSSAGKNATDQKSGQWNVRGCVGWRCSEGERKRGPGWVLGAGVYLGRSCQLFLEQDHYTGVYFPPRGGAIIRVGVMIRSTLRQKVNSSKKKKKR